MENKRGGKRDGSGRKPLSPKKKKEPLTLYVEGGLIKKHGKSKLRLKAKECFDNL